MPDGDVVHARLAGRYQKPYRVLCEGAYDHNDCAWIVMNAIKKDIQAKGSGPILLAKRMRECLDRVTEATGEDQVVDWLSLSLEVDRCTRNAEGPPRTRGLVRRAAKGVLHDLVLTGPQG